MSSDHALLVNAKKYIFIGIITIIPLWVTLIVLQIIFNTLVNAGRPIVLGLAIIVRPYSPAIAAWLSHPWFQSILALTLVLCGLYFLGFATTKVIGKQFLHFFDSLVKGIPLIKTVYSAVKQFLDVVQQKPGSLQRVVLIDFPTPEMKAIGFITKTLTDKDTGAKLAVVYVPTTPNPTSGYLEIVPVERVITTDWTVDEAMAFVISGGTISPDNMNYAKSLQQERDSRT